jgi:hypothetical protein
LTGRGRSGDGEIENLIGVSFFENLVGGERDEAATLDALRPWLSSGSRGRGGQVLLSNII